LLAALALAGLTTVVAQTPPAPAPAAPPAAPAPPPDTKVETVSVAPGVYMLIGRGGNVGVSVGDDGVAIIDSQFADMAPKLRAAAALLSESPVKFLINTHLHGDHTGGNDAFGRGGATLIAHENVRKRLLNPVPNPQTGAAGQARAKEALPVFTFADGATLHWNGDDLEFVHMPNAHTDTDIAIRFRKANVVHMGDCFTGGFPFIDSSNGGSLDGLIAAHEKIIASIDDATKVIRGHGPLGNKAELTAYKDMLTTVRNRVAKLVAAGKSQEQVVATLPTKEFEAKYGSPNFNAAQWVGRVYVDQQVALEKRKKARKSTQKPAPQLPAVER
jgi:glyoxylase-like metal-dependent hydrolase (beta-lactamase superfamily II)